MEQIMKVGLRRGFSLIEILCVVAVFSLLMVMVVPTFGSMALASSISRGGQDLASVMLLARQEATTRNRTVYVRFIQLPDEAGRLRYRAAQSWIAVDDSETVEPLGKLMRLPSGIVVAENAMLSPFLAAPLKSGSITVDGSSRAYKEFGFMANGSVNVTASMSDGYLTVAAEREQDGKIPNNFISLFINQITGQLSIFQP